MVTEQDVYIAYRKAKSLQSGKGFRLPKDFDEWYNTKLTETNRCHLSRMAGFFNTTLSNINIDIYMECGFELFKTFSYHMFLSPKVLQHYIDKDKRKKRRISASMTGISDSFAYIKSQMKDQKVIEGYTMLQSYCKTREGDRKLILNDYMRNFIDPLVVVYCLYYKYLILTDIEREYMYPISNRYRELLTQMFEVEKFIKEKENE